MKNAVVSTRIRLARNLKKYPFVCRMTDKQKAELANEVTEALANGGIELKRINIADIPREMAYVLVEEHLISPELAADKNGTVLLSDDKKISVMLNEEDHIRIQVFAENEQLDVALKKANEIDDIIDGSLEYAFDMRLGYLTQCPTNLGTGLRASVMLHLPVLTEHKAIGILANALGKIGMTVRGIYGEGSEAKGCMYQISNQVTLGISETEAVQNLKSAAKEIAEKEAFERDKVFKTDVRAEDRAFRALGILKYSRLLSSDEFMRLISDVRMGIEADVIKDISLNEIDTLIKNAQPAAMIYSSGTQLSSSQRDAKRAELVRSVFDGKG